MDATFAIAGPPFNLQLTAWDRRMPSTYSKRVLCFALPNDTNEKKRQIVQLLSAALRATVQELPFLAGSIVPFSRDQSWLHDIRNGPAAYLEVKDLSDELSFSELRKANFSPSLLQARQLCPFPENVYNRETPIGVCRFRANFIQRGLLLVVSVVHTVCDGRGISNTLRLFADKFREAQESDLVNESEMHTNDPHYVYAFNRNSVLSGRSHVGAIDNHPAWTISPIKTPGRPVNAEPICKNFHISSVSLRALKQAASSCLTQSPEDAPPNKTIAISTNDAIAAFIWRGVMFARHRAGVISNDAITHCTQAVDCRGRLHLPEPYYGNAIYGVKASLGLSVITSDVSRGSRCSGLAAAARAMRLEVNSTTGDMFRDLLAFVEKTEMQQPTRLSVIDELSTNSILFVSYWHFGMHELDFGPALGGKIEAFRLPSSGLRPGMPVVLPRLPDGSCEFSLNEQEDVMEYLDKDELFMEFASQLN
ncbi:MAG: hypothetical protein Q9227_006806 [Pyrenula ochraceoflavens]